MKPKRFWMKSTTLWWDGTSDLGNILESTRWLRTLVRVLGDKVFKLHVKEYSTENHERAKGFEKGFRRVNWVRAM